mmetsp:Transcript_6399/g.15464  ORF Transcript_6399/g.15464 Transcript_6399/m.15464 type:complete len:99 (-) Transcript_6399:1034-1330(-)
MVRERDLLQAQLHTLGTRFRFHLKNSNALQRQEQLGKIRGCLPKRIQKARKVFQQRQGPVFRVCRQRSREAIVLQFGQWRTKCEFSQVEQEVDDHMGF